MDQDDFEKGQVNFDVIDEFYKKHAIADVHIMKVTRLKKDCPSQNCGYDNNFQKPIINKSTINLLLNPHFVLVI